ncbi:chromosomal replication initiator protein DnaA [Bifidobacterium sp. B4107]|uniref:chromosomal replication initiator protein DnaA n=1 Tax=unclassified Bifidobacterium TaxID=2608897 RepID=UPI00226B85D9|nr:MULTISPECIES: chromosomal replication initiator protein DnaA [unclassified Bifidobacterium]MCX8647980.1 chromosomal replication initiator protein DnaA [Bifidobacterium sp. B4107]MCX8652160.1 chromosomal replication initiator protein DnaA [Bifidobacterium sp. B4111]MCX8658204.1 chromosomal replication initiator protein DnaA [Bifidobacterium sp. B4114]
MAQDPLDAAAQAKRIWDSVLQVLRYSSSLTSRDKGWLEDITPEAVFGTTIVLRVSSKATQEAVQGPLSQPLLNALQLVTNKEMFPAIKIVYPEQMAKQKAADQQNDQRASAMAGSVPGSGEFRQVPGPAQDPYSDYQRQAGIDRSPDSETHSDWRTENAGTSKSPIVSVNDFHEGTYVPMTLDMQAELSEPSPAVRSTAGADADQQSEAERTASRPAFTVPRFPMSQNRVERDPQTHLNKNATFDTFVPGDSNRFARTVALAVAEGSGQDFNPLCIYGSSGLGKTHLLNAIGNYALVKDPSLKVRYVNSEEFTNEFIDALQNSTQGSGQIAEFNRRYRQVDVLLIDDIQFLGGKEATLDQFFHTFNALHDANKRIVIASDVAPKNLKGFESRLISRFDSGLTVDVKPPDRETRVAILRMMASMNGVSIPNEVLDLIAERFTENIRELEGALTRVTAVASLNNQPVTTALAEQTLQDFFSTDVEIKPTDIISQVAKYFHLTFDDIVGRTRTKNIALARQIAMYLAREMTSMSLVDIGEVFGGRDHTTVMHAYTRISNEMQEKREIYNYVMELTVRLKQPQE